jgi:hypothetical protein
MALCHTDGWATEGMAFAFSFFSRFALTSPNRSRIRPPCRVGDLPIHLKMPTQLALHPKGEWNFGTEPVVPLTGRGRDPFASCFQHG